MPQVMGSAKTVMLGPANGAYRAQSATKGHKRWDRDPKAALFEAFAPVMRKFARARQDATLKFASEQVDLKLVLATDVSRSIDDSELQLEREGTSEAFLDPEVVKAIQNGSLGRIAVATFDFSSPQDNRVTMEWHIIHDRASAAALRDHS